MADKARQSKRFLPRSITIPGTLHLVNNLVKEVVHSLSHFPRFFDQLKYYEMLWKEGRLDRYIEYCLSGTAFEARKNDFEIKLGSLYKECWNVR